MESLRSSMLSAFDAFMGEVTSRLELLETRLAALEHCGGAAAATCGVASTEQAMTVNTCGHLESRLEKLEQEGAASRRRSDALLHCLAREGLDISEGSVEEAAAAAAAQALRPGRGDPRLQLHPWSCKDEVGALIECLALRREQIEAFVHKQRFAALLERCGRGGDENPKGLHDVFRLCRDSHDLCSLETLDCLHAAAASRSTRTAVEARRQRLYLLCGFAPGDGGLEPTTAVEALSPASQSWEPLSPAPSRAAGAGCAVVDGRLFLCGGDEGHIGRVSRRVQIFNPWQPQQPWGAGPELLECRTDCAAAGVDGVLFVCGGTSGDYRALKSGERLDVRSGSRRGGAGAPPDQPWGWERLPDMCEARTAAGATILEKHLWVSGGRGSHWSGPSTASVECLDCTPPSGCGAIGSSTWALRQPMPQGRSEHGACSLRGHLYVCGGQLDGHGPTSSVERWDPQRGLWEEVEPMSTARIRPAAATMAGKLFVCGGGNGHFARTMLEGLGSVEKFDPEKGVWQAAPSLRTPRAAMAAGVLPV